MKPVKKLTTKHVFGGPKEIRALFGENPKDGDRAHLMKVIGIATKVRDGESTMGAFSELQGDFRAVTSDGSVYHSGKCFIPDGAAHDATVNAVRGSDGDVEFAFNIDVIRDESSASGYVYDSTSLIAVKESDRMGALMDNIGKLEAPKEEKAKK